jgi:hypothetical protein
MECWEKILIFIVLCILEQKSTSSSFVHICLEGRMIIMMKEFLQDFYTKKYKVKSICDDVFN